MSFHILSAIKITVMCSPTSRGPFVDPAASRCGIAPRPTADAPFFDPQLLQHGRVRVDITIPKLLHPQYSNIDCHFEPSSPVECRHFYFYVPLVRTRLVFFSSCIESPNVMGSSSSSTQYKAETGISGGDFRGCMRI